MRVLQKVFQVCLVPKARKQGTSVVLDTFVAMTCVQKREFSKEYLNQSYLDSRKLWESKKLPDDVNHKAVFANNELDLRDIEVYGFDYDYTLANYEPTVEHLIYNLGKNVLVSKYRYPEGIKALEYQRDFAVRGLHFDIEQGLLMKLDQFQQIQLSSIYRGMTCLAKEEVLQTYGHRSLPIHYVEGHLRGTSKMAHLADLFSIPEMCLLSQVAQFFMDNKLSFHSVSLFNDVKAAITSIHPEMHRIVGMNIEDYLIKDPNLITFFNSLKENNKEVFIITNSPFAFVNVGMSYLLGDNWQDYFDVVIANAKKPAFFTDCVRPFRELNREIHMQTWGPVNKLEKGKIYLEGNLKKLQELKGWQGEHVLYFGDHPYSDLADVSLHHGWRTGAIIWELDYEISCLNSIEYKKIGGWLQILQGLIESCQNLEDKESRAIIREWEDERDMLRKKTKEMYNRHFGSVFRTHDNPTYFSRRLFRFADIYTSRLSNLNEYSINYTFYPRRGVLPHEYKSLFV